jgi:hypothetical protein
LHQPGLEVGQFEGLLELANQDVVEVVGNAPEKEQADDQPKDQQVFAAVPPSGKTKALR